MLYNSHKYDCETAYCCLICETNVSNYTMQKITPIHHNVCSGNWLAHATQVSSTLICLFCFSFCQAVTTALVQAHSSFSTPLKLTSKITWLKKCSESINTDATCFHIFMALLVIASKLTSEIVGGIQKHHNGTYTSVAAFSMAEEASKILLIPPFHYRLSFSIPYYSGWSLDPTEQNFRGLSVLQWVGGSKKFLLH